MNIKGQNGRTMIEMLGVVVIIGMILIGALIGYSQAIKQQKVRQVFDDISWLSLQMERFWTWVNEDNIKNNIVGEELFKYPENPFAKVGGGGYQIKLITEEDGDDIIKSGYSIQAFGLDGDACDDFESDTGWADIGGEPECDGTVLTVSF